MSENYCYFFVYDDEFGDRGTVRDYLDQNPKILNWCHCLPHSFFIVSQWSASVLMEDFLKFSNSKGRFFIVDTNSDKNGWIPKHVWDFINKPGPPPVDSSAL